MLTTEQLVAEAGGIDNLAMFSGISPYDATKVDQLAAIYSSRSSDQLAVTRAPEIVIVRAAYSRSVSWGGSSGSNWSWDDTGGSQTNDGGGDDGTWTLVHSTASYAERSAYYCSLHNTSSIGSKTNFFAAASRVMRTYARIDPLSDSPSGIPGDQTSWQFLRYNRSISEFLRNVVNPEIAKCTMPLVSCSH